MSDQLLAKYDELQENLRGSKQRTVEAKNRYEEAQREQRAAESAFNEVRDALTKALGKGTAPVKAALVAVEPPPTRTAFPPSVKATIDGLIRNGANHASEQNFARHMPSAERTPISSPTYW